MKGSGESLYSLGKKIIERIYFVAATKTQKHLTLEKLKRSNYAKLYTNEELERFCEVFNHDVSEERKKNSRGAWKVRMILYS